MRKRDLGILIICAFAILWSFRGEGDYYFTESWVQPIDTTLYDNLHYPSKSEKLPKPLITDLDGDGQNDIVYTTRDSTIKVLDVSPSGINTKSGPMIKAQSTLLNKIGVRTGRRPVGLASGYLQAPNNQEQPKQVVVVITDGWIVMCFNHNLELLWEHSPVDEVPEGFYHEEVAIMIAPHPARVGDEGIVVVGGRLVPTETTSVLEHEHETEHVGPDERIERESEGHHFSYYAFDGKTGAMRWKHEEGDFYNEDPHEGEEEEVETFMPLHSYKQHVFSQVRHLGEVDWRQYKQNVLSHLPYRWVDGYDTRFVLDRFTKKTNFGRSSTPAQQQNTEWNVDAIGIPNPMGSSVSLTPNQISPKRDVEKPNVIVATVKGGLEIIHLFTGRPLCRLLLPSLHATTSEGSYVDVNGDEIIDQIIAKTESTPKYVCQGVAIAGVPAIEQLWNGSICGVGGTLESMLLRGLSVSQSKISTIPPTFLPSSTTSGLDSIFMISSGKVTAFSPNGRKLWWVDSRASFLVGEEGHYPALTPIHVRPSDSNLHVLAMGSSLTLIGPDGQSLATRPLRRDSRIPRSDGGEEEGIHPVAPPAIGDFNNDGVADVIVLGHDGFYGFAIQKGAGSGLFMGLVLALIGVMVYVFVKGEAHRGDDGRSAPRKRAID